MFKVRRLRFWYSANASGKMASSPPLSKEFSTIARISFRTRAAGLNFCCEIRSLTQTWLNLATTSALYSFESHAAATKVKCYLASQRRTLGGDFSTLSVFHLSEELFGLFLQIYTFLRNLEPLPSIAFDDNFLFVD